MNTVKRYIFILAAVTALTGCSVQKEKAAALSESTSSQECSIECTCHENTEFGSVLLELTNEEIMGAGFEYGDSVSLEFGNGKTFTDVPFYDGFYGETNQPVLVDYQSSDSVEFSRNYGDPVWEETGCGNGERVIVTLEEKKKYLDIQNTLSLAYSNNIEEYQDDVSFVNFRAMSGGNMADNLFYRGASPVNNANKRAACTDRLLKENNINFVVDLADSNEKIEKYEEESDFDSPYFLALYEKGQTAELAQTAAYRALKNQQSLAQGFRKMIQYDGPYYIHCTEGKDRTGFACMILESIGGFTYEEMKDDYMETYANYYGITEESQPEKYDVILDTRFNDMAFWLAGIQDESQVSSADFEKGAHDYLIGGGMTEDEYDKLKSIIRKE